MNKPKLEEACVLVKRLNERSKSLAGNILTTLMGRGVNLAVAAIIVPLSIRGLGKEGYGFFAVILSMTSFFTYADLGLGLALVNRLAGNVDKGSKYAQEVVSRNFIFLCILSIIIIIVGAILLFETRIANLKEGIISTNTWWIFLFGTIGAIPASLTSRILFAYQRNGEASIWNAGAKVGSLIGVYYSQRTGAALDMYVASMLIIPLFVTWIQTTIFFSISRPDIAPSIKSVKWRELTSDAKIAAQFLILQFAIYAETGLDVILIGYIVGHKDIAAFDVTQRLFNYVPALITLASTPLWPAIAHAVASNDLKWAKKVEKRGIAVASLMAACAVTALILSYRWIIPAWTGQNLSMDLIPVLLIALTMSLSAISQVQTSIISGYGHIGRIIQIYGGLILMMIPLKVVALKAFGIPTMLFIGTLLFIPKIFLLWKSRKIGSFPAGSI